MTQKSKSTLIFNFITLFFLFHLIGCGKRPEQKVLEHIYVETKVVNQQQESSEDTPDNAPPLQDVWVSLVTELNLGGLEMTAISLPVHDPKNPGEYYGELKFTTDLSNFHNIVEVNLNLSKVANVKGSSYPTLPTGEDIPFRGVSSGEIIELEVPNMKAKVYVLLRKDTVIIGYASVVEKFSEASGYLGGADVFFAFNKDPIRGSVGFFSDKEKEETGIGVFADLSKVLSPDVIKDFITNKTSNASLSVENLSKQNRKAIIKSYMAISENQ